MLDKLNCVTTIGCIFTIYTTQEYRPFSDFSYIMWVYPAMHQHWEADLNHGTVSAMDFSVFLLILEGIRNVQWSVG